MAQRTDEQEVLARVPDLLLSLEEQIRGLQAQAHEMGRDLYLAGMSWADVGRLLGVSRQAARQRFGPAVEAWRSTDGERLPWQEISGGPMDHLEAYGLPSDW